MRGCDDEDVKRAAMMRALGSIAKGGGNRKPVSNANAGSAPSLAIVVHPGGEPKPAPVGYDGDNKEPDEDDDDRGY